MAKLIELILVAIITLVAAGFIALIAAIPVYFLWNWLCPGLFALPVLTYWQAAGLAWLCGCLFKSSTSCECEGKK